MCRPAVPAAVPRPGALPGPAAVELQLAAAGAQRPGDPVARRALHGGFEPVFPSVHLKHGYYHLVLLVTGVERAALGEAPPLPEHPQRAQPWGARGRPARLLPARAGRALPPRSGARSRARPAGDRGGAGRGRAGASRAAARRGAAVELERDRALLAAAGPPGFGLPRGDRAVRAPADPVCRPRASAHRARPEPRNRAWPGLEREPQIKLSHRWRSPPGPAGEAWSDTPLRDRSILRPPRSCRS